MRPEESPESQIIRITAELVEYCKNEYQLSGDETARGILLLAARVKPHGKRGWVEFLQNLDGDDVDEAFEGPKEEE